MTTWTNSTVTATQWTSTALNATGFNGKEIINLGAKMDDSVYLMDDAVCTMDDMKLNIGGSPPTIWT